MKSKILQKNENTTNMQLNEQTFEETFGETFGETFKENVKSNKRAKKMPVWKKIAMVVLIIIMLLEITILILFYGPISTFRDWWITTAMTTMSHQYLAEWFFNQETINAVLSKNKVEEIEDTTNADLIIIQEDTQTEYKNEFEKQILARNLDKDKYNIYDEGENYRIIKISGKGYSGYLAAIYDPSKVKVATTKYVGTSGQYLTEISKQNNAVIAINGGGFADENSHGNGSTPLGIVYSNGKFICNNMFADIGGLIRI